jgi:LysM repeat protein
MKIKLPLRKPGPPRLRPPKLKLKASVASSRRRGTPIVEEEDFEEEPEPNMKLSHAFVVVLVLHVIAVAGVFAFNSVKARHTDIVSPIAEEPAKPVESTATAAAPEAVANTSPLAPVAKTEPAAPIAPVAPAPAVAKTHELQPGETLTKVAKTYGVTVAELQAANNIDDPKTIRAGTALIIPGAAAAAVEPAKIEPVAYKPVASAPVEQQPIAVPTAATPVEKPAAAPVAAAPAAAQASGTVYTVVKGDNPWKIAKKFKVPYSALLKLNNITDPNHIQIGQKLQIPAAK